MPPIARDAGAATCCIPTAQRLAPRGVGDGTTRRKPVRSALDDAARHERLAPVRARLDHGMRHERLARTTANTPPTWEETTLLRTAQEEDNDDDLDIEEERDQAQAEHWLSDLAGTLRTHAPTAHLEHPVTGKRGARLNPGVPDDLMSPSLPHVRSMGRDRSGELGHCDQVQLRFLCGSSEPAKEGWKKGAV